MYWPNKSISVDLQRDLEGDVERITQIPCASSALSGTTVKINKLISNSHRQQQPTMESEPSLKKQKIEDSTRKLRSYFAIVTGKRIWLLSN